MGRSRFLSFSIVLASLMAPVPAHALGSCEAGKNDYFEELLRRAATDANAPGASGDCSDCKGEPAGAPATPKQLDLLQQLVSGSGAGGFPLACFDAAMRRMPENGSSRVGYGICGQEQVVRRTDPACKSKHCEQNPRPCLSESYEKLVANSFGLAMSCVGLEAAEVFPLWANESGFHVNIGSFSGAWGAAQLTPVGVVEVNRRGLFEELRSRPECEGALKLMAGPLPEWGRERDPAVCAMISPPGNPLTSFVYGGLLYRENKRAARRLARKWQNAALPKKDRTRLEVELARYMYNGGPGAIEQAFLTFIAEPGNATLSYGDFQARFSQYLNDNYLKSESETPARTERLRHRRGEISAYTKQIRDAAAGVRKLAGGAACGSP